jgi:hypothetical protein
MRWQPKEVTITFADGEQEVVRNVGGLTHGVEVADGVLRLTYKGGEAAPVEHCGSFPLVNVQSWREVDT